MSSASAWPETGSRDTRQSCPGIQAAVVGAEAADFSDICFGAAGSLDFLASHGIRASQPVLIEVTASIPAESQPTAAGCYIAQQRRAYVVPYSAFREHKTWFGLSINREIYRSLAAHEAAHAVAACNFRISKPTIQAQEYVAYVAMFSAMSPELREQALRATPTEGFASWHRFTPLLYMFDPMRFGAEAYRHFSGASNKTELLQDIFQGRILVD